MTRARLLAFALVAMTLAVRPGGGIAANEATVVQLVEVSSRVVGQSFEVLIEANAPGAYATHQPDDRTVIVELRNVTDGARMQVARGGPIADVLIEEPGDDATTRVSLRPVAGVVAPATNGAITAPAAQTGLAVGAPATRLRTIDMMVEPYGLVVRLGANGILTPSSIQESEDAPPRLVIDLPEVESDVAPATRVDVGPVRQVRVAPNSHVPLVTRVVFDLETRTPYRIEGIDHPSAELRVIFPLDNATETTARTVVEARPALDPLSLAALAASTARMPTTGTVAPSEAKLGRSQVSANTIVLGSLAALRAPGPANAAQEAAVTELLADLARARAAETGTDTDTVTAALSPQQGTIEPRALGQADPLRSAAPADVDVPDDAAVDVVLLAEPALLDQVPTVAGAPRIEPAAVPLAEEPLPAGEVPLAPPGYPLIGLTSPESIVPTLPAEAASVQSPGGATLRVRETVIPVVAELRRPPASRTQFTIPAAPSAGSVSVGSSELTSHGASPKPGLTAPHRFSSEVPTTRFIRRRGVTNRPRVQVTQRTLGGGREYSGRRVSMDFQNADLRSVLRTFAEISDLNIVIDPQVEGSVDVALVDVPWDQALDAILRANQLGYDVDGTVVRIAPLSSLADEERQRRELAEEQALAGELVVLTRTLSYARAADLADLVAQAVLSSRGQVQFDARTNTLILTDLQGSLQAAQELIDTLDRREPQVEIEARIVQARQSYARELEEGGVLGRVATDVGPPSRTSALGLTLGSVDDSLNLDVVLSAAEGNGDVRILSNPRVTTQNNVQATIVQGDQIPIQTVSNNTVTVQFKDAALRLAVTPQITAADTVIMQVEIDNDFANFGESVNGIPPIVTQRAITTVQVANGDTAVIGGIYESARQRRNDRVPGLSRIPLLGWLFRRETDAEDTDELLIFLTPHIIR